MTQTLVTTREAAQLIGCSCRTIDRMREAGDLRPVILRPGRGGFTLFDRAEVMQARNRRMLSTASVRVRS